jgi:hypothetical protein
MVHRSEEREFVHRRVIWTLCVLAGLVVGIAPTLKGQSGSPTANFVILKCDDLTPSSVHLTIIVVDTAAEAESLWRKLESGARFESLAIEHSRHPTAATGGEFGVFSVADLRPEFRAALNGVKPGGYTPVIAVPRSTGPGDWPEGLPLPGASLKSVESVLGRSYSATTLPADGSSVMTEVTYPFGVRLRIHESRGLGFMEFTARGGCRFLAFDPTTRSRPRCSTRSRQRDGSSGASSWASPAIHTGLSTLTTG